MIQVFTTPQIQMWCFFCRIS